ncbi:MAG TPA: alanine racemase [Candidatus Nanopelagicales bacterium]
MSFVISIDTPRWRAHQATVRDAVGEAGAQLVPVAKGNGYGVGNTRLAEEAVRLGAPAIAVGTVYEAAAVLDAQPGLEVLVLEPFTLRAEVDGRAWRALAEHPGAGRIVHTIASPLAATDLAALASPSAPRRVLLEGVTSMRRFGMTEDEVASAISTLAPGIASGAVLLDGLALHLPIATPEHPRIGSMAMLSGDGRQPEPMVLGSARVHEVVAWGLLWPSLLANLAGVADAGALWVSHLQDAECVDVRTHLPDLPLRLRMGTRLWLGDRGALRARGTVLAVHPTADGQPAGYHQRRAPKDGHVLVVSGGTSHGVAMTAPRPARNVRQRAAAAGSGALEAAGRFRSPFHLPTGGYAWFLEPPHMHVSMLRVARGVIPPPVGESLDCDVRFTTVQPDVVLG